MESYCWDRIYDQSNLMERDPYYIAKGVKGIKFISRLFQTSHYFSTLPSQTLTPLLKVYLKDSTMYKTVDILAKPSQQSCKSFSFFFLFFLLMNCSPHLNSSLVDPFIHKIFTCLAQNNQQVPLLWCYLTSLHYL